MHEIDQTVHATGAVFSVRMHMWHQLGNIVETPPRTVDEALELAGCNFNVYPVDLFTEHGTRLPDNKAIVRGDTGRVLGVVGNRYMPVQNRDAFLVLQPLIESGLATWETGGSLREGRDVWGLIKFNFDDQSFGDFFKEQGLLPYAVVSNNHSGKKALTLMETIIRIVCANTLGAAHSAANYAGGKAIDIRHTQNAETRLIEAAMLMWSDILRRYNQVRVEYETLQQTYLTRYNFNELVLDAVAPWPEDKPHVKKNTDFVFERVDNKRNALVNLWYEGTGHSGDPSAWDAYNAVCESFEHDPLLWATGKTDHLQSLVDGTLGRKKAFVLDRLMEFAVSGTTPITHA